MNFTEQEKELIAKIWKSEKFVWKRERFIKKSEEFLWKNGEFVWKSEKKYMAQRYSKYRFFGVNCILSILFQVQLWGCPGKPKFQFHILCVWSILYIYIYIYSQCQNYRTEPGVQKYGKIPYLRTPPDPDSARIRIRSIIEFPRSIIKFLRSIIKFPRSIISGTSMIFTAYLYIYNL